MEETAGYKKLNLFQRADELVILIYKFTKSFPKEETFGLISQMRRAAVSVPANIAEGYSRNNKKERLQFYCISRGSLAEVDYYIELSFKLKYLNEEQYKELIFIRNKTGKMLNGFINYHIHKN